MNKSRQIALLVRLHRHHKTPVPLGDDVLLQDLGIAGRGNDFLQNLATFGQRRPHVAADIPQLRAGGVRHGIFIRNAAANFIL